MAALTDTQSQHSTLLILHECLHSTTKGSKVKVRGQAGSGQASDWEEKPKVTVMVWVITTFLKEMYKLMSCVCGCVATQYFFLFMRFFNLSPFCCIILGCIWLLGTVILFQQIVPVVCWNHITYHSAMLVYFDATEKFISDRQCI